MMGSRSSLAEIGKDRAYLMAIKEGILSTFNSALRSPVWKTFRSPKEIFSLVIFTRSAAFLISRSILEQASQPVAITNFYFYTLYLG